MNDKFMTMLDGAATTHWLQKYPYATLSELPHKLNLWSAHWLWQIEIQSSAACHSSYRRRGDTC